MATQRSPVWNLTSTPKISAQVLYTIHFALNFCPVLCTMLQALPVLGVRIVTCFDLVLPLLVRVTPVDLPFPSREQGGQRVACHPAFLMDEAR